MTMFICLLSLFLFIQPGATTMPSWQQDEDYAEGRNALGTGDYQKAIERFSRFAERKPKEFRGRYYLGLSYRGAKQYDEAIAAFRRAAELQPDPPFAQYEIGKTFLEMKNYDAVMEEYQSLRNKSEELATYLHDLMPQEMIEQFHLPPSTIRTILKDRKAHEAAVNNALQTEANPNAANPGHIQPMGASLRPTILYRERAKYTEIARLNMTQGTVLLSLVYTSTGEIRDILVIRSLPDGMTRTAIESAKKIRFNPAIKDGQPVHVRGNVEFNFTLY